jgi:hypothetical protein
LPFLLFWFLSVAMDYDGYLPRQAQVVQTHTLSTKRPCCLHFVGLCLWSVVSAGDAGRAGCARPRGGAAARCVPPRPAVPRPSLAGAP